MKIGRFILNIGLALIWCMMNNSLHPVTFIIGFFVGWLSLSLFAHIFSYNKFPVNMWEGCKLLFVFIYEIVKANFQIAFIILSPRMKINPGIIEYPLDIKNDGAIVLLANMISLTPGTLTVDISEDRKYLYVHAMIMESPEKLKERMKKIFENRILKMTGETERKN